MSESNATETVETPDFVKKYGTVGMVLALLVTFLAGNFTSSDYADRVVDTVVGTARITSHVLSEVGQANQPIVEAINQLYKQDNQLAEAINQLAEGQKALAEKMDSVAPVGSE